MVLGEERLVEVLTAPLDSIVDVDAQTLPPEEVLWQWRLPESDLRALSRWGLPHDGIKTPDFQTAVGRHRGWVRSPATAGSSPSSTDH